MSSTNYRAFSIAQVSASCGIGPGSAYPRAWGIMKGESNCSGSLLLEGGGSINLASLDNHQMFPCYAKTLTITAGSILILS
jgi:hypothetical protein